MDIKRLTEEVRQKRRKLVDNGTPRTEAFNLAFQSIAAQYSEITPENFRDIKSEVGKMLARRKKKGEIPPNVALFESRSKKVLKVVVKGIYSVSFIFHQNILEVTSIVDIPEEVFTAAKEAAEKYFGILGIQETLFKPSS